MTAAGPLVAGRYRLRSQLGGGGMGAVWLARDELLGREVAVKQVLVPLGIDAELAAANREAAMREGRIAARLSHPHAVAVYDMVLDQGQPWLVMEYLPSRSLAVLLQDRGVLPVAQVAQIGAQVAAALTATHAAGVVHRDVKPGNILIGEGPGRDGLVKITDFGISRATGDVSLTQTGVVKGTPAFLAPEVAQGQSPNEASDVFSLGGTLYACLEGTPPFGLSDNALQMLHRVAGGEFTPPRNAGPLTAPLMRMLAPNPVDRPTMPQVRDQLAKLAAGPDRDVTEVLTARTALPKTLPGMPRPPKQTEVEPVAQPVAEPAAPAEPAAEPLVESPVAPAAAAARPPRREPARPAAPPSAGQPGGRRRRWVAVVAALLLVAVVAVVAVVLLADNGDPSADAQRSRSSSAAPSAAPSSATPEENTTADTTPESSTAESTTPSVPSTTPTTPTTPTAPESAVAGPPTAAEMRDAVTSYYALAERDPQSAYDLTGPTLRNAESRGNYIAFWNRFRNVTLGPVQATDGDQVVTAPVTFVEKNGDTFPAQHTITVIRGEDGRLLIDSDIPD
ncbi:Serine/threonine protein kinase [Modestobacter sp. DSM 44400]|uniref:serine/threonine-protein kinase n=1 Tax=Modestobacter sp. DSM 44400 TaxID=1550230 RepID=UPI0008995E4A|nr:serine/threonine-protein kinase [Modestobacter sp. DSM 44400]SDY42723.1 Serine/threonine protein kinase [Modestobacter sp. DSM 44400]